MSYANNTENIIKKTSRTYLICRRECFTPAMQKLLSNPEERLHDTAGLFLKNSPGEKTTVVLVTVDNRNFIVKRYNVTDLWHSLKNIFRKSRALRSWNNGLYLERHSIPTPRPVAVLIKHFGPIQGNAYFITEHVDGLQGRNLFTLNTKPDAACKKILENVVELLKKLFAARVTHDDFQLKNMIFVHNIPVLLDLDYMQTHKYNSFWFRHNFRKDVENFLSHLDKMNPEISRMATTILDHNKVSRFFKRSDK